MFPEHQQDMPTKRERKKESTSQCVSYVQIYNLQCRITFSFSISVRLHGVAEKLLGELKSFLRTVCCNKIKLLFKVTKLL